MLKDKDADISTNVRRKMKTTFYTTLALSLFLLVACSKEQPNAQIPKPTESQVIAKAPEIINVVNTTWRGTEGGFILRQYTFLPNGILRLTWLGVDGNQPQDNDNGTWTQNENELYFQFNEKAVENFGKFSDGKIVGITKNQNGSQRELTLSQIDLNTASPLQTFSIELKEKIAFEKSERIKENCAKLVNWSADSRELIARALNVSMASVSFVRGELGTSGRCLVVVDTPKGPTKCQVDDLWQDKESKEYIALLGGPLAVQAVCGGLAY